MILNVFGLPVVVKGGPTLAPLVRFSAILIVCLLIVMVFSKILVTLITKVAVLALASGLVIWIVSVNLLIFS